MTARLKLISLALVIAVLGTFIAAPLAAETSAQRAPAAVVLPVTGTLADGGTFVGTVSNLAASSVGGVLTLSGVLNGTATSATGVVTQVVNFAFSSIVIPGAGAACRILTLDIGAINLNLLGLVIDLAPIALDITAVPGRGNLLGNLLCAVVRLFDGGSATGAARLLNRFLSLLG